MINHLRAIPGDGDRDGPRGDWEGDLDGNDASFQAHASTAGREWKHAAEEFLVGQGAQVTARRRAVAAYWIDFEIRGPNGYEYVVLTHGTFDDDKSSGLRRTDTVKKMGYDAVQIHRRLPNKRIIVVSSHPPVPRSAAAHQLADLVGVVYDVITIHDLASIHRLGRHLRGTDLPDQVNAPWEQDQAEFTPGLFDTVSYEQE